MKESPSTPMTALLGSASSTLPNDACGTLVYGSRLASLVGVGTTLVVAAAADTCCGGAQYVSG